MLGNFSGWSLSVVIILLVWACLLIRKGPHAALAASALLSFVFPVWLILDVSGLPLSIRTTVLCVAMLGYVFHPQGRILSSLTMLDVCMALLCLTHIASDSMADGLTVTLPFRAYGEWVIPYVAGRFAIRSREDLEFIAPWVAGVLVVLGLAAVIETLTRVNPFELVFGNRPQEMAGRNAGRLGLKRAFGPTMHPIFLGMLITVLTPWIVCLWQNRESQPKKVLGILSGIFAVAGILCTLSRTPAITVLTAAVLLLAVYYKPLRWPVGMMGILTIIIVAAFPAQVTDLVSRITGGGDRPQVVEIDGEAVMSSSSRSRLLLFAIYREPLIKAGLFGYGSKAVATFPLDIPNMQGKLKSANLFEMVDNGYILLTLRFGWLGGACLVMLFITTIATGFFLFANRPHQLFPAACACLLTMIASFSMLAVWLCYDFGLPLLWMIGIISGLASARTAQRSQRPPNWI